MSADRLNAAKQGKIQDAVNRMYGYGAVTVLMAWAGSCKRSDIMYTSPRTPGWHGHATINRALTEVTPAIIENAHDKHEPCGALLTELAMIDLPAVEVGPSIEKMSHIASTRADSLLGVPVRASLSPGDIPYCSITDKGHVIGYILQADLDAIPSPEHVAESLAKWDRMVNGAGSA